MNDSNRNIRGIHYEISEPKKGPDGYHYQRVRQVDERGNLVGIGEQRLRSESEDGLVAPSIDLANASKSAGHLAKVIWGILKRNPAEIATGGAELGHDLYSGWIEGYKSWPGTESPWEPIFDWRTGGSPVGFVHGRDGALGDGNGIGSWSDASADFPRGRPRFDWESEAQGFENVPVPNRAPPVRSPTWNDVFVRDSAAAAGVPSRNNVYEYGFPEPGSVQPPLRTPGATRGIGYTADAVVPPIPFIPAAPQSAPGGLPGMMVEAGLVDPLNPHASPPGGLVGLIQEYLRNNARGNN
jgi:hypothetical protein